MAFRWVDIEDEAELLGGLEVEDFPVVLIVHLGEPRFFGTVMPNADTLRLLLRSVASRQPLRPDPALAALVAALLDETAAHLQRP
ncbi:thiol-disulfide isomerase [Caldimonas brevitalea]|uniref:Thiol-disulfide isomerase n=1 Tax=Caldimonas brevitalea TaxID=413882 RepID=A0A0G3BPC7_9BURK|nr:thiol-disulfide isomerase [Caldimonas brevitalea]